MADVETGSARSDAADDPEITEFRSLQSRLRSVWEGIQSSPHWEHTSVVVPSISFDQEELEKITGVPYYEERLLFTLMRLRHPGAHVIYVTGRAVHPEVIDYYLHHLVGVPASHARKRLAFFSVQDASPRPLSQKIHERPRLVQRIRQLFGDPARAYLTCFNSSVWERKLALALGIPLNGLDPALCHLGTKSGSRAIFREAGVPLPAGTENVHSRDEIVQALSDLRDERGETLRHAVLKLNDGFSGEGNALFEYPEDLPPDGDERLGALDEALDGLRWSAEEESAATYFRKFADMGGVVEEFVEAAEVHSPSAQARIHPDGSCGLISTHEQLLGGGTGQVYLGCRFPANAEYRLALQDAVLHIAKVLATHGVVSRLAVDFLAVRDPGEPWRIYAIEINLRMGGTTHPFLALEFLTGGALHLPSGEFVSQQGQRKYYVATDGLTAPSYRGLLPEDLMEIVSRHGLHYRPSTETGVLFHMIGALSESGKVGVTCIGNSPEEAEGIYRWTVEILDRETGAERGGQMETMLDQSLPRME